MRSSLLLAAALLASWSAVASAALKRGYATAYSGDYQKDATGGNACGFGRLADQWERFYAAPNANDYRGHCGDCIAVRGIAGQVASGHPVGKVVVVKVVDVCPLWACPTAHHIDLSSSALKAVTGYAWDKKKVDWDWVSCASKSLPSSSPKPAPKPAPAPAPEPEPEPEGADPLAAAVEAARAAAAGAVAAQSVSGPGDVIDAAAAGLLTAQEAAFLEDIAARREARQDAVFAQFVAAVTGAGGEPAAAAAGGGEPAAAAAAAGGAPADGAPADGEAAASAALALAELQPGVSLRSQVSGRRLLR